MEVYIGHVKRTVYLSRYDDDHKIRASNQRPDIGKYCFVYRKI